MNFRTTGDLLYAFFRVITQKKAYNTAKAWNQVYRW
jgi:hypothetical protein